MKLLADEDFDTPIVRMLQAQDVDIITVADLSLDNVGTADEQVLKEGTSLGRAVITFNRRDFWRLHQVEQHAGIVLCKRNTPVLLLVRLVVELVTSVERGQNELYRIIQP